MLTDQCKIFLDEALTAIDNNSKLSVEATAHLETCIECRRSLESVKALKASTATVLPIAALGSKSKIATRLEGAMKARSVVSAGSKIVKTTLATGSIILGVGLAGAITTCSLMGLRTNNSNIPFKNSDNNYNKVNTEQPATSSVNISNTDKKEDLSVKSYEDESVNDNNDLRINSKDIDYSKTSIPSVVEDNGG